MSYLNDIEGLRGENLASAALAHVLMRSEAVRRAFIDRVSALSPVGPIIVRKQFAVFTEVSTDQKKRIDLLIQTDDAVVGIENKFSAGFQEGQPKSYVDLIEDKAASLSSVWNTGFQSLLIVLAPESREKETNERIAEQGIERSCVFLAWESLMSAFSRKNLPELPPVDRFLVDELDEHVKSQTGAIDLARLMQHIDNPWQDRGSAVVRSVFGQVVWPLLNESLIEAATYGGARSYHGYNLSKEEGLRAWIGFIDSGSIPDAEGLGATFIVALRSQAAADALGESTNGRTVDPGGGWSKNYFCVAVDYDTKWTERAEWEPVMTAINEALLMSP